MLNGSVSVRIFCRQCVNAIVALRRHLDYIEESNRKAIPGRVWMFDRIWPATVVPGSIDHNEC